LLARGEDTSGLGVVHRLDRLTSGLLVFAKTLAARKALAKQVEERQMHREYVAFAVGVPQSAKGSFHWAIRRDPSRPTRMQALTQTQVEDVLAAGVPSHVSSSGYSDSHADIRPRSALTHYAVLRRWPGICLLRLRLETGRTHQIRVHAQAAGLPLIGDPLYGPAPGQVPSGLALERPALHARHLAFTHPITAQPLSFRAALPADLVALWHQLGMRS
jgi:23S rRNA pseudouridine1911/1915/1917 synthase